MWDALNDTLEKRQKLMNINKAQNKPHRKTMWKMVLVACMMCSMYMHATNAEQGALRLPRVIVS